MTRAIRRHLRRRPFGMCWSVIVLHLGQSERLYECVFLVQPTLVREQLKRSGLVDHEVTSMSTWLLLDFHRGLLHC